MSEKCWKNLKKEINYEDILKTFIDDNEDIAFIPDDQKDTNRFHWHSAAEKLDIGHKTLKLWTNISLCGTHNNPIIGAKSGREEQGRLYDSDYECDYECNSDEEDCWSNCCYKDETKLCKMRTIVIFNKEGTEKIKNMRVEEIKDFLVKEEIIEIVNKKYTIV